jgi:hypothetical protein
LSVEGDGCGRRVGWEENYPLERGEREFKIWRD